VRENGAAVRQRGGRGGVTREQRMQRGWGEHGQLKCCCTLVSLRSNRYNCHALQWTRIPAQAHLLVAWYVSFESASHLPLTCPCGSATSLIPWISQTHIGLQRSFLSQVLGGYPMGIKQVLHQYRTAIRSVSPMYRVDISRRGQSLWFQAGGWECATAWGTIRKHPELFSLDQLRADVVLVPGIALS
jgi:hypothetical protein